jgi:short-subunit dehydrogenase
MESSKGHAIVTGASSGIGYAYARELARKGYAVIAVARRRARLDQLSAAARAEGGVIEGLEADLETRAGIDALVERAAELDDLALLVNSAGFGESGYYLEMDVARELACIQLNVASLVELTHRLLPQMVRRRTGAVVNVASTAAFQAMPFFSTYAATKAFVLSYSEGIAHELRGTGVRVTCVCPGPVKTEFMQVMGNERLQKSLPNLSAEEVVKDAILASEGGRVVRVVGALNRLLVRVNWLLPRALVRSNMASFAKPATAPKALLPAARAR